MLNNISRLCSKWLNPTLLPAGPLIRPDFQLHPAHEQDDYWPITYIEPAEPNKQAVGLDMAFETNRYTAIKRARDTGRSQVTGPIVLVQDDKQTPGFLLYAPFYAAGAKSDSVEERRRDLIGVTYAPFIMYKLIQGVLPPEKKLIDFRVSDNGAILYDDDDYRSELHDDAPMFERTETVTMYGREWVIEMQSNLLFREVVADYQPLIILLGGLVIDALILVLFLLLSRGNRAALAYADKMTESLEAEKKKLQISNEDLNNFAYVASHDLKSPLRGIDQLATWVEEDIGEQLDAQTRDHLRLMRSRIKRMETLLDDLLTYSRVGRTDQEVSMVDTHQLVEDIFELQANASDLTLRVARNMPTFRAQKVPLELVLRNLISNAIKHHDKDAGTIYVAASATVDGYEFAVQDDGPGISPEHQQRAFTMFQTLKSRDQVEGSGMGLAMVKKEVEAVGGTVSLRSDGLSGSTFLFTWPASR